MALVIPLAAAVQAAAATSATPSRGTALVVLVAAGLLVRYLAGGGSHGRSHGGHGHGGARKRSGHRRGGHR